MSIKLNRVVLGVLLLLALVLPSALVAAAPEADAQGARERFIVVAKSDADHAALREQARRSGGEVVKDVTAGRAGRLLVVNGSRALENQLAASGRAVGVAKDQLRTIIQPNRQLDMVSRDFRAPTTRPAVNRASFGAMSGVRRGRPPRSALQTGTPITPDPAIQLPGLLWNLDRINARLAWETTLGSPDVTVAVADTGLDFTHAELSSKISQADVVDLTDDTCKTFFGMSDADLAAKFGGPEKTDWNGHGTWIGGNIAAALDGQGINGIAPNVKLVPLKISQWCGFAFDSSLLAAFLYAANNRIDVVSISFGGYIDRSDPTQNLTWVMYEQVVQAAKSLGTVIVAAAGNEAVRVDTDGKVVSHGPLTNPSDDPKDFVDLFGWYEAPGGVPGVVDVSSTGNVVRASTPNCERKPEDVNSPCKPTSDPHQQTGVDLQNQLAYYSNYGPRIDVAGPGGARKFNLPFWDGGGTPGFPFTINDLTTAFQDFSITSNWAVEIPCFVFDEGNGVFPGNQCYSTIQGTSMATPHASATLALIASTNEGLRHQVGPLVAKLKESATAITVANETQTLSATDHSPGDLTRSRPDSPQCVTGYCHLGGTPASNEDAYGAGLVNAATASGAPSSMRR